MTHCRQAGTDVPEGRDILVDWFTQDGIPSIWWGFSIEAHVAGKVEAPPISDHY
jgi:hypothetical protein